MKNNQAIKIISSLSLLIFVVGILSYLMYFKPKQELIIREKNINSLESRLDEQEQKLQEQQQKIQNQGQQMQVQSRAINNQKRALDDQTQNQQNYNRCINIWSNSDDYIKPEDEAYCRRLHLE